MVQYRGGGPHLRPTLQLFFNENEIQDFLLSPIGAPYVAMRNTGQLVLWITTLVSKQLIATL